MFIKPKFIYPYAIALAIALCSTAVFAQNPTINLLCNAEKTRNATRPVEARVSLKLTKNKDTLKLEIETPAYEAWLTKNKERLNLLPPVKQMMEMIDVPNINLEHNFFSKSDNFHQKITFDKTNKWTIHIIEIWNEINGSNALLTNFHIDRYSGLFVYRSIGANSELGDFEINGRCENSNPIF